MKRHRLILLCLLSLWAAIAPAAENPRQGAGADSIPSNPLTAKSVGDLQKIVETDVDSEHRYAAVDALAAKGSEALPQLKAALKDPTAYVRYRAAQALGEMGGTMTDEGLPAAQRRPGTACAGSDRLQAHGPKG